MSPFLPISVLILESWSGYEDVLTSVALLDREVSLLLGVEAKSTSTTR